MRIITLSLLDKFFKKLLNGDKKFKEINTENLKADKVSVNNGLSADTINSGAITCTTINTQGNNINAGAGIVSGRIRIPTTAPNNPQPGDIWIS